MNATFFPSARRSAFAVVLALAVPAAALADQSHPGGGGGRPSSPSRAPSSFNFSHDINAGHVAPVTPAHANVSGGPFRGSFRGPVIGNPRHWGGWGWNHGVIWNPSSLYWGGGFFGPFAFGALTGALLYGSVIDDQDQAIYPSYQVEPSSPGAQLLQNYGLTQTPCGPPNLVVIWGPDGSVVCAYPNDMVSAGNYELDPSTLTLTSSAPPPPNQ
jgi:hypothetical protein